jgi:hypothetical protein
MSDFDDFARSEVAGNGANDPRKRFSPKRPWSTTAKLAFVLVGGFLGPKLFDMLFDASFDTYVMPYVIEYLAPPYCSHRPDWLLLGDSMCENLET